ncbi:MAG: MmgE/PrpD family protein, partial [Bacteroidales bacterium]|nr:MmgE/PrpD family protein [Bacteroidales bacterium]
TLAAAATSAAGMLEVIRDQSELKPYNAGRAAAAGLMAASVARAGFKGPDDVLNGAHGFLKLFSESPDLEKLKRPSAPAIHSIYVKPWAACRHSHAPVEAILNLRKKIQVRPEEVESITVFTYGHAVHLHDHTEAASTGSAKMSTPYSVAVALLTGRAGLEQFSPEMIARRDVQDMTRKVAVLEDPEMTRRVPAQRAARVRMIMKSGKQHEAVVELPKGEPEHPLSEEELAQKFTELATFAGKSKEECRGIIEVVHKIEDRAAGLYPFL